MTILNLIPSVRRVDNEVQTFSPTVVTSTNMASAANMIGKIYTIINAGTAYLQVNASDGSIIGIVNPGCAGQLTPNTDIPTTNTQWNLVGQWKEYASNSNTTNATTDTTSFANGQAGSNIPNGAVGTSYTRTVQLLTSIQKTDRFVFEVSTDGLKWLAIADRFGPRLAQGTNNYGAQIVASTSTQLSVEFGAGGVQPNNASYAGNSSTSWAAFTAFFWRVAKYTN